MINDHGPDCFKIVPDCFQNSLPRQRGEKSDIAPKRCWLASMRLPVPPQRGRRPKTLTTRLDPLWVTERALAVQNRGRSAEIEAETPSGGDIAGAHLTSSAYPSRLSSVLSDNSPDV
jgi:hypothetical protein